MPAPRVADGDLVTAGGRVLTVVGRGADFAEAIARAYAGVAQISFDGMQFRRDIGRKALERIGREVLSRHLRLPRQPGRFAERRGGPSCRTARSQRTPTRPTSSS